METAIQKKIDQFFSRYAKHSYKKAEVILRAEDPPAGIMYLKKGFVRMYVLSENGEMLVLHVFKPGSFFPMMWALNDTANRYFFEAMSVVELHRAPREDVSGFVREHPDVLYDLTVRLLSGASGLLCRMEHLVLDSAYVKAVKLLLYFTKNFGVSDPEGVVISLTHREVAAWIGTTRETASLQIEALIKKGLLSYRKRQLVVRNPQKLEAELQEVSSLG